MLVTSVRQRIGLDGATVVEALVHLTPEQAGACADAVQALAASRYRVPTLTVDEILAMREFTALGDGLDDLRHADGTTIMVLSIARLGLLIEALDEPTSGSAVALVGPLAAVHAEALRAALEGPAANVALS
jgi:hypothetical protein